MIDILPFTSNMISVDFFLNKIQSFYENPTYWETTESSDVAVVLRRVNWADSSWVLAHQVERALGQSPRAVAPGGRYFRHQLSASRCQATKTSLRRTTRTWAWSDWAACRDPAGGHSAAPLDSATAIPSPFDLSFARGARSPNLDPLVDDSLSSVTDNWLN